MKCPYCGGSLRIAPILINQMYKRRYRFKTVKRFVVQHVSGNSYNCQMIDLPPTKTRAEMMAAVKAVIALESKPEALFNPKSFLGKWHFTA